MRCVLVEIDEDALAPLLLPPVCRDEIRSLAFELAGQCDSGRTDLDRVPKRLEANIDVQPTVAARLWESDNAKLAEELFHAARRLAHLLEADACLRIQVDTQLVGMQRVIDPKRPDMEPEATEVDCPDHMSHVGDHESPRARAVHGRHLDGLEPVRSTSRHTFLEKRLPEGSVREPLQHRGPAARSSEQWLGDGQVIADEVELGRAGAGEEDLVGMRDLDDTTRHLDGLAFGSAARARHRVRLAALSGDRARQLHGDSPHLARQRAR